MARDLRKKSEIAKQISEAWGKHLRNELTWNEYVTECQRIRKEINDEQRG